MFPQRDIKQNFVVFQNLVARADSYLNSGNYLAAAVFAEIAAAYATHNHSGLFVSYQLEDILLTIGREIANKASFTHHVASRKDGRRHVLHVLTEAAVIGGLTRMVWRWIQLDTDSLHSVVITRQHKEIPQALIDAVKASGGSIYRLNDKLGNILTWSLDLRMIAASVDVVILHIYTWDVIPLIAFADKRSIPPIIYLNQSDHKFWVGASISDVVADQRYSGSRLTQTRRGIDKTRCGILPIVVPSIPRRYSVSEAKAQIGLSADTTLLLSIARSSKYVPFIGSGSRLNDLVLPEPVLPVLQQHLKTALIVIGPAFSDQWEQASQTVQGRIIRFGMREDTSIFYQAADIYLDSFPFASNTSCLEAGNFAVPLVSCHPYSELSDVLCADTPALDKVIIRVKGKAEYISVVTHLIEDLEYRTLVGKDTRENIISVHTGEHWKGYLHDLYRQAENTSPAIFSGSGEYLMTISELDVLCLDIDILKIGEQMVVQDRLRLFPFNLRVNLWVKFLKEQHMFRPSLLLSEWMAVRLIKVRDNLKNKGVKI